jgi:RNA polymerase sigma-70 factor (ECF subfamily)
MADEEASNLIEAWVDAHGDRLYRHALSRVKRAEVAEDLVQETFIAAMRSAAQFRGEVSPVNWLLGILRHKIMDHFRASYRAETAEALPEDDELGALFDERGRWRQQPGPWTVDDDLVSREEFWRAFRGCLDGLPARLRDIFTLRVVDDVESDAVCKALRISATNLWVSLHRARTRLRGCLEVSWFGADAPEAS